MSDAVIGATEKILFSILAQAHLVYGGTIGFRGKKWLRATATAYVSVDEKGETVGQWAEPVNTIQSLILTVNRERKTYDDVYFFFLDEDGSYEGITWRMLKIDMSFLRVVLNRDELTMKEIIRRFARISEKAMNDPDEPFDNLN